jgi:hypothetical protein
VLWGVNFSGSVNFELLPWFELFLPSELFLALSCHFAWLYRFSYFLLAFTIFLLLHDLLELFLAF